MYFVNPKSNEKEKRITNLVQLKGKSKQEQKTSYLFCFGIKKVEIIGLTKVKKVKKNSKTYIWAIDHPTETPSIQAHQQPLPKKNLPKRNGVNKTDAF